MKNNTLSIVAICLSIATIAGTIGVHKYAKLNDELVVQASERKIDRVDCASVTLSPMLANNININISSFILLLLHA
jgi:hypothetical protein